MLLYVINYFFKVIDPKSGIQELDKVRTEAARIVTGATKLVSLRAPFDEVNWEPL